MNADLHCSIASPDPFPIVHQRLATILLLCSTFMPAGCGRRLQRHDYHAPMMGTEFRLVIYSGRRAAADAAAAAAFAEADRLNSIFSDYDQKSEIRRLGAVSSDRAPTPWIPISDDLCVVLEFAQRLSVTSQGAFDVTIGPLAELWRRARRLSELPDEARLEDARSRVGFRRLELDARAQAVRLLAPNMKLDFGAIAKGYAADRMLRVLEDRGCSCSLVVCGGETRAGRPPPERRGWRIKVETPHAPAPFHLEIKHAALSSSGDTYQFVEVDGIRYSHIVDPRTADALTRAQGVTVLAADGLTADALATALCVLSIEAGRELVAAFPGVQARWALVHDGRVQVESTSGFPRETRAD